MGAANMAFQHTIVLLALMSAAVVAASNATSPEPTRILKNICTEKENTAMNEAWREVELCIVLITTTNPPDKRACKNVDDMDRYMETFLNASNCVHNNSETEKDRFKVNFGVLKDMVNLTVQGKYLFNNNSKQCLKDQRSRLIDCVGRYVKGEADFIEALKKEINLIVNELFRMDFQHKAARGKSINVNKCINEVWANAGQACEHMKDITDAMSQTANNAYVDPNILTSSGGIAANAVVNEVANTVANAIANLPLSSGTAVAGSMFMIGASLLVLM